MWGARLEGTPSPWSLTSTTTDGPLRRACTSTVPRPWTREFSKRVLSTWLSATGVALTTRPRSPWTWTLRRASSNAGCHSRWSAAITESSDTSGRGASLLRRLRMRRSSTTRVSRSTWSIAMPASSLTTSGSSVSEISSSRMSSAVSGVRSWWEASDAKSRSAASVFVTCWALRESTFETRSTSGMPDRIGSSRAWPSPSRSAASASWIIGSASRLDALAATRTVMAITAAARSETPRNTSSPRALGAWVSQVSSRSVRWETSQAPKRAVGAPMTRAAMSTAKNVERTSWRRTRLSPGRDARTGTPRRARWRCSSAGRRRHPVFFGAR